MLAEQSRRVTAEQPKPSIAQLIQEAWNCYKLAHLGNSASVELTTPNSTEVHGKTAELALRWDKYHTMLHAVRASGNKRAIRAVQENLEVFYDYIGGDPDNAPETPPAGKPKQPTSNKKATKKDPKAAAAHKTAARTGEGRDEKREEGHPAGR